MCKRESKQYEDEKEWHMQFYRNVTCNIDEDVFRPLFDEKMGCPTKAIRQLVAMSILKEGKDTYRYFDTPKRIILHHPKLTCRLGITSRWSRNV